MTDFDAIREALELRVGTPDNGECANALAALSRIEADLARLTGQATDLLADLAEMENYKVRVVLLEEALRRIAKDPWRQSSYLSAEIAREALGEAE